MRAANADVPLIAKIERPQALEHLDAILTACGRRDGGARRSRAGVPARADPPHPENDHRARARAGTPRHPRHAGPRIDADRAAPDARGSQRRRDGGRSGRRRDHAVGGDGGRRLSGRGGRDAVGDHRTTRRRWPRRRRLLGPDISLFGPHGRGAAAGRLRRVPHRARPRDVRGRRDAGVDRTGGSDRRRHAARQDRAAAVVAAPAAPASSPSRRPTSSRAG